MSQNDPKIGCIIVLYNPNLLLLEQVVASVENQVHTIFFADNSDAMVPIKVGQNLVHKKMNGNIGIAAAQNEGIRFFMEQGFTHLFFLDQDSILEPDLVHHLSMDLHGLKMNGISVGAIGARPFNRASGKKYQASVTSGRGVSQDLTEVGEIMNSASLVPIENFAMIGFFEEKLFIDGVDHEWCWRAKTIRDFRFFISEKASISHFLGEGDRFFLVRKVAIPTPFRAYYQFRNYLLLSRRGYVPTYWKLKNGCKLVIKFFYLSLFVKPRLRFFVRSLRGIYDGFTQ